LGPAVAIEIARPREHKALNRHPEFKHVRSTITQYLLGSSAKRRSARKEAPRPVTERAVVELGA
jgi:hypothetical protein